MSRAISNRKSRDGGTDLCGEWFHFTGTEVGLLGSGVAFVTALTSLVIGQHNEQRRMTQMLEVERLRIAAARDVEERRIDAASEAERQRWAREALRAELAQAFASVDRLIAVWEGAAEARAIWLRELRTDFMSRSTEEAERSSTKAWEDACWRWEELDATLASLAFVGSPAVVEAAAVLHQSFESMRHHLRPPSGADDPVGSVRMDARHVRDARWRLVEAAREAIGLGPLRTEISVDDGPATDRAP